MADIVLAIPEIIGHIHKCIEFAQAYAKVYESFSADVEHVERITKTVTIMDDLLKERNFLKADREIAQTLDKLRKALEGLYGKLEKWKDNLQYHGDDVPASPTPSIIDPDEKGMDPGGASKPTQNGETSDSINANCDFKCVLSGIKWLRSRFSFRWRRTQFLKRDKVEPDAAQTSLSKASTCTTVAKTFRRVQFLAYIDPNIKESLKRVDRALEDLFRLFSLSMMFSRAVFSDETSNFVEKALLRIERQDIVPTLSIPSDSLVPLDNAFNESSQFPQSLFYVEGGEYGGCLVDRRFVRDFVNRGKGEWVQAETERVSRMMAEDLQDKDGVSSSNIPVLRSCGVAYPHTFGDFHDVVFRLPQGSQIPQTLRRVLVSPGLTPNLRTRASLAFHLASALTIVRRLGVVHKRIRPESIVLVRHVGDKDTSSDGFSPAIGMPYLAGFTQARQQAVDSALKPIYGSDVPEIIYHHPDFIVVGRRRAYQMDDDIYSLGVCLLEIGLWRSIACWDEVKSLYDLDKYWKLDILDFSGPDKMITGNINILRMLRLVEIARRELPLAMGPKYANIVATCLEFGMRSGEARTDADSPQSSGVEFVSDVVTKLFELKLNL